MTTSGVRALTTGTIQKIVCSDSMFKDTMHLQILEYTVKEQAGGDSSVGAT